MQIDMVWGDVGRGKVSILAPAGMEGYTSVPDLCVVQKFPHFKSCASSITEGHPLWLECMSQEHMTLERYWLSITLSQTLMP